MIAVHHMLVRMHIIVSVVRYSVFHHAHFDEVLSNRFGRLSTSNTW